MSNESVTDALYRFSSTQATPAVSLVGMAQIGKSTVIHHLQQRLSKEIPEIITVYITLAAFSTAAEFQAGLYNEILRATRRSDIPVRGDYLAAENTTNINLRIRELLEAGATDGNARYLIVVDDFDEIRHIEQQRRITQSLRELIQRVRETRSQFVIISRRELVDIEMEIGGSSLFGICTFQLFLTPTRIENEATARWSGGHTHIARVVAEAREEAAFLPAVQDIYARILTAASENIFDKQGTIKEHNRIYWRNKWQRLGIINAVSDHFEFFAEGLKDYFPLWLESRRISDPAAVSHMFGLN